MVVKFWKSFGGEPGVGLFHPGIQYSNRRYFIIFFSLGISECYFFLNFYVSQHYTLLKILSSCLQ